MKRVFIVFLILLLTLTLFVACDKKNDQLEINMSNSSIDQNDYGNNVNNGLTNQQIFPNIYSNAGTGVFYSLETAYAQNIISFEDLLSIAYYNNGGKTENEALMGADFLPKEIAPNELGEVTAWRIKNDYIAQCLSDTPNPTVENVHIDNYYGWYGFYNNCIALKISDDFYGIAGEVKRETIENVTFVFPSYEVLIWKMDVELDFADDCVLVGMDNVYGGINKDIGEDFFAGLPIVEIIDLTKLTQETIDRMDDEMKANHHQILELRFDFHDKVAVLQIVEILQNLIGVKTVEPNIILYAGETANDTEYSSQWGLNDDYGINIENAWEFTTGSTNVRVGIIDTGIFAHNDLQGNLVEGVSFVSNVSSTTDTNGHGTHVAGIVGAVGDNYTGITGVCKHVSIVPLRISETGSWPTDKVISAIVYATNLWGTQSQIDILNFSGWNFPNNSNLYNAIDAFPGLFVNIAGNGGEDIDVTQNPNYPGSYIIDNMITVGSIDSNGQKSSFSNFGNSSVDIFAPGRHIYSLSLANNTYEYKDGTSMAAPFVTGVAALVLSYYPNISTAELKARLLYAVNSDSNLANYCTSDGRLNAYKAFHNHAMSNGYIYYNNSVHRVQCTICGYYTQEASHTYSYQSISVTGGHYKLCNVCSHNFGAEGHVWLQQFINGTPHGYKCKKCNLWTLYIDIPIEGLAPGIRGQLESIEIGENGIGVLPVSEHVAIIYDNGRYGIIVECDEQGRPLEKIPKEIFAEDFDVDALQKELDKKTENLLAIQEEQKKTLKELFAEDE